MKKSIFVYFVLLCAGIQCSCAAMNNESAKSQKQVAKLAIAIYTPERGYLCPMSHETECDEKGLHDAQRVIHKRLQELQSNKPKDEHACICKDKVYYSMGASSGECYAESLDEVTRTLFGMRSKEGILEKDGIVQKELKALSQSFYKRRLNILFSLQKEISPAMYEIFTCKMIFPTDCEIIVRNMAGTDMQIILHARDHYCIEDAQSIALSKIIDHTRDFTKREDGALDPDHKVSLVFLINDTRITSIECIKEIRAGHAWYALEKIMRKKLAVLSKIKKTEELIT